MDIFCQTSVLTRFSPVEIRKSLLHWENIFWGSFLKIKISCVELVTCRKYRGWTDKTHTQAAQSLFKYSSWSCQQGWFVSGSYPMTVRIQLPTAQKFVKHQKFIRELFRYSGDLRFIVPLAAPWFIHDT